MKESTPRPIEPAQSKFSRAIQSWEYSSSLVPEVSIFDRNRKPWDIISEDIVVFETQPDWKPGDGSA